MVIGAAGELPKPPSTPVIFLEGKSMHSFFQHMLYTYLSRRYGRFGASASSMYILFNNSFIQGYVLDGARAASTVRSHE